VEGVDWQYHCVLTFDDQNFERVKKDGASSKELSYFFKKLRKEFTKEVHCWKYEEGSRRGRSHFHLMLELDDFDEKGIAGKLDLVDEEALKRMSKIDGKLSPKEVGLGLLLKDLWGKGRVWGREIKNEYDLKKFVEKDFAKSTETKYLKERAKFCGFSRGLSFKESKNEYDYVDRVSRESAFGKLKETKKRFIDHFTEKNKNWDGAGRYIYHKTVGELMDGVLEQKKLKDFGKEEKKMEKQMAFMKRLREIFIDNELVALDFKGLKQVLALDFSVEYVEKQLDVMIKHESPLVLDGKKVKLTKSYERMVRKLYML